MQHTRTPQLPGTARALDDVQRRERTGGFAVVAAMAILMWLVETIDIAAGDLDGAGIRPRDPDGLVGVATSPFLHGSWGHLIGNTIPFVALGMVIAIGGLARVAAVTGIVAVVGGLGTWLTAPSNTVVIGASGLIFGYATYLIARGVYTRRGLHLAGGLIVLAVYGTTLLFGLVPTPGVSWQAHLFGGIGGVVAARALHRGRASVPARQAPAVP
jgi:membrane associated rhomboid family serine protease